MAVIPKRIGRRRAMLSAASMMLQLAAAKGQQITVPRRRLIEPTVDYEVHISYGQSWRSNEYPSYDTFGFSPTAPIPLNMTNPFVPSNVGVPLPNTAGFLFALGNIIGLTTYSGSTTVTIGRCAILTQQLLRTQQAGVFLPIVEFCAAYPGSTWRSGAGGGLSYGASFTGAITDDTMTISGDVSGLVNENQRIIAPGLVSSLTTATIIATDNLDGTYTATIGQSVGDEPMSTATATWTGAAGGSQPGNRVWVLSDLVGTIEVGQVVTGDGLLDPTVITQLQTDFGDGILAYLADAGDPQTIPSQAITTLGVSWNRMLTLIGEIKTLPPPRGLSRPQFRSVGYTQGAAADSTEAGKILDLTQMLTALDALELTGQALNYFLDLPAPVSNAVQFGGSVWGTYQFARANAPGVGGPWSGRCFLTTPASQWQFTGEDNIHTGAYGTTRWGEVEGYARHVVQDLGIMWTPLWRSMTLPIIISGNTFTVPFDRPTGPEFAAATLSWQSNANDGIKVWPQMGWHVRRSGIEKPLVGDPVIDGLTVVLDIGEAAHVGDEVSYAWYGPGGPDISTESGVGGNLCMLGPPSVLYPDGYLGDAKTIACWAFPFVETVA